MTTREKLRLTFRLLLGALALTGCSAETGETGASGLPETETESTPVARADTFFLGDILVRMERSDSLQFGRDPAPEADSSGKYAPNSGGPVRRSGDTLELQCGGRTARLINNNTDSDEYSSYIYMGYIPRAGQFLVYGTFYEWYSYLLIDTETGDTTYLAGTPRVSPDNRFLLAGNDDLEAGFTFNGFELYTNTHKPVLVAKRELADWGPAAVKWENNNTLLVKGVEMDAETGDHRLVFYRLRLEQTPDTP